MMKPTNLHAHLIISFILLVAVSVSAQQPAQQPAAQPPDDTISGRVVSDSGQPIVGVNVSLNTLGGSGGQRTSTDNEGNFKFRGLDGGIYRFYLSAPGYVTQSAGSSAPIYRPGDKVDLTMMKGAVITGSVINMAGEPVVNVQVRVFQVRDADGNKVQGSYYSQPAFTDDRGIFRMWSLRPGTYVVAAGGQGQYFGSVNPFANDAMTYAPASTRDTAAEVIARSNQEVNVDIRYRGERGHAISGKVSGVMPSPPYSPAIYLVDVETRTDIASLYLSGFETYQVNGVADGEYEIVAKGGSPSVQVSSAPRRVGVHGADVTGVDLSLAMMASIDAHVSLEADQKLNCGRRRDTALRETLVNLRRFRPEEKPAIKKEKPAESSDASVSPASYEMVPNPKGDIRFAGLYAGPYRFEVRLPAGGWYLKDLSLPKPESNVPRNGLTIKQSENVSGVAIKIAEGGASLRGRVSVAEDSTLPANLRMYLVPAERPDGDNPLRFFEDAVAADGTFVIGNITPGSYWLLAQRAEPIDDKTVKSPRLDNDFRAKLLKDAATANKQIVFKPCERTVDYEFRYAAR